MELLIKKCVYQGIIQFLLSDFCFRHSTRKTIECFMQMQILKPHTFRYKKIHKTYMHILYFKEPSCTSALGFGNIVFSDFCHCHY